jgi:signal transduction histidine kinase
VALVVQDDGPGVAPEQREEILRRGVRGDERVPGSGLGLAIVSELVTLYKGELALGKSPWGGLSVRLQLPLKAQ